MCACVFVFVFGCVPVFVSVLVCVRLYARGCVCAVSLCVFVVVCVFECV